jgi:hypothetical protein
MSRLAIFNSLLDIIMIAYQRRIFTKKFFLETLIEKEDKKPDLLWMYLLAVEFRGHHTRSLLQWGKCSRSLKPGPVPVSTFFIPKEKPRL